MNLEKYDLFEVILIKTLISEYQAIEQQITTLRERIDSIYYAAASPGIKTISDMPMAPGFSGGGLEDTFIRIEELEECIWECKEELAVVAERIETRLDLAGVSGTARVVFWYREVHCKTWREIAALTDKSVRQLQRIYKKTIYMSLLL